MEYYEIVDIPIIHLHAAKLYDLEIIPQQMCNQHF